MDIINAQFEHIMMIGHTIHIAQNKIMNNTKIGRMYNIFAEQSWNDRSAFQTLLVVITVKVES